jgi:hypothetical protein
MGKKLTNPLIATAVAATADDLLYVVDDPGGTPISKKITAGNFVKTAPPFNSADQGLTPASGGGTSNFLRADGTWATPVAPGPGTDPLFLVNGLSVIAINPVASGDLNDRWGQKIRVLTDCSEINPTFSNNAGLQLSMDAIHGQATNGGGTNAKVTFLPLNMGASYNASGQKFLTNENIQSFGMSDTAVGQQYVQYAGGPVNGDEGQAFRLVCNLQQQPFLNTTTITSKPTQSVVNTTTTQAITASQAAQTVTVASAAGAVNGDWVVIEQQIPNGQPNLEAVKIISFTGTSIRGVFRHNHAFGVTVTPALVISCASTYQMGQDRVLVNLSAPSYSTGTIGSISGGAMNGSGTTWSNGMVGGTALNIGAISLAADDCTAGIWSGTPLKSWYQITAVSSATSLAIHTYSAAGDQAYHGRGPGPAGTGAGGGGSPPTFPYVIRPAARVLRVNGTPGVADGFLICETSNAAVWSVGHNVEQAICPYADISGFQYRINHFTPGGAGVRAFLRAQNWGARMWSYGILLDSGNGGIGQATGDLVAMDTGIAIDSCNTGIYIGQNQKVGAIGIYGTNDAASSIFWGGSNTKIGPSFGNGGLTLKTSLGFTTGPAEPSFEGWLQFLVPGATYNISPYLFEMTWGGWFHIGGGGTSGKRPFMTIDWTGPNELVNYARAFIGWGELPAEQHFIIATQSGGTEINREISFRIGANDHIRLSENLPISIKNTQSYSANGAVATVLGSVGPAGASTTVQKWLTIRDDGGVTRYIPCF